MKHKSIIFTSLFVTVIAVAVYSAITLKLNRDRVIDNCLQVSSYTSQRTENGATIVTKEPIDTAVQKCLTLHRIKIK